MRRDAERIGVRFTFVRRLFAEIRPRKVLAPKSRPATSRVTLYTTLTPRISHVGQAERARLKGTARNIVGGLSPHQTTSPLVDISA